jgi:hypothetical protein
MRELHGVIFDDLLFPEVRLKQHSLLFDKVHIWNMDDRLTSGKETIRPQTHATIEFLRLREVLFDAPLPIEVLTESIIAGAMESWIAGLGVEREVLEGISDEFITPLTADFLTRLAASKLPCHCYDSVPICRNPLPDSLFRNSPSVAARNKTVLAVAIDSFPAPDATCAWQDILDFKAELHDKHWGFRRFLNALATKQQSEAEIRDDIEWSLNEYTKSMDRFKIKRSVSFMKTYVIPAVEVLENFKPSSFLKALVSIRERKVALLEGEASAPGRECAYVFDAQQRFAGNVGD